MKIEVFCEDDTKEIAYNIAKNAKSGDIYCLCGDLGTGKTQFSKGFSKGLLIEEDITSPTFTIVNEYDKGKLPFYHFDVYRINDVEELYDIGYEEYFFGNGVCLIEWAELIKDIIPKNATWIKIYKNLEKGEDYRIIEVIKDEHISY
ncbi:tRNA (adenosine(37)-N6)-threonylcarbamoyltransferase complex ATPase subunit type 1 TsaE [uncultured Tyzzerella sp.]|uniref:tRNA (adenosine(37)-N6)-threonylcarbamoyltransferase complex ATPase subunit type 1 TsaE n=1 Tax=uncultured Tyzzerella sp. TaxID=2321398 RepID=UPI002942F83F|nr:tRNA (adenosine(37)-N6)-threonylcarbamoyltransferase complex ATPase subunit type 1 TsaE [uncultured Tyzzerella sp.]